MIGIGEAATAAIFSNARTMKSYISKSVDDAVLESIYHACKFGPTAFNCTPLRIMYITTDEAKARMVPLLAEGNRPKVVTAPVLAVLSYDMDFPSHLETLAPFMVNSMKQNPQRVENHAVTNSWLQAGYFITAVRAHGLDCGPMTGFDNAKVDAEFFADKQWKSFMVLSLGYGDVEKVTPRAPRLEYEQAVMKL